MKKTDEIIKLDHPNDLEEKHEIQKISSSLIYNDEINLDNEISKLSKTNRRAFSKVKTREIVMVSLLLSMSTAGSFINVWVPLGFTGINFGFMLKYFIIAISFQVVGVYWGMIIGLLDGLLQFIILGGSPLFRVASAIGLMMWVFLFWLFFKKIFNIYANKRRFNIILCLFLGSIIILIVQPLFDSIMFFFITWIETGNRYMGLLAFATNWIGLMIFYSFTVVLFALTTCRIQLIINKMQMKA